jgi:hypothetical protein
LPVIAIRSICAGLLEILKEIPSYGIDELYAKHGREYNVFWREPFFSESLNRAVLTENQLIKADFETLLCQITSNVNYLAWPDPKFHTNQDVTPFSTKGKRA